MSDGEQSEGESVLGTDVVFTGKKWYFSKRTLFTDLSSEVRIFPNNLETAWQGSQRIFGIDFHADRKISPLFFDYFNSAPCKSRYLAIALQKYGPSNVLYTSLNATLRRTIDRWKTGGRLPIRLRLFHSVLDNRPYWVE